MGQYNSTHNRAVWFDIPVRDLERASKFYREVLGIAVTREEFDGVSFAVLEHKEGNGGCLVVDSAGITAKSGILVYFNVEGRMREAVAQVAALGGSIIEPPLPIGPHGVRALALDSEGNRIALHSTVDD